METNSKYTEILKLAQSLTDANIPHTLRKLFDGWQVIYLADGKQIADAIEHMGSYGRDDDLLEIMGLLTDDESQYDSVKGGLTAEEVFDRIQTDYRRRNTMNTAEMWLEAQKTGYTYESINGDILYSKNLGLVSKNDLSAWSLSAWGDGAHAIDALLGDCEWAECKEEFMTIKEAEEKYGVRILLP